MYKKKTQYYAESGAIPGFRHPLGVLECPPTDKWGLLCPHSIHLFHFTFDSQFYIIKPVLSLSFRNVLPSLHI